MFFFSSLAFAWPTSFCVGPTMLSRLSDQMSDKIFEASKTLMRLMMICNKRSEWLTLQSQWCYIRYGLTVCCQMVVCVVVVVLCSLSTLVIPARHGGDIIYDYDLNRFLNGSPRVRGVYCAGGFGALPEEAGHGLCEAGWGHGAGASHRGAAACQVRFNGVFDVR